MTDEEKLLEKLRLVETLHAGAATPGEKEAAAQARERILARLKSLEKLDPPIEFSFKLRSKWSRMLLVALLRRYDVKPYRYRGQRHTSVTARLPRRFVDETLWPEFLELNRTLEKYLDDVTQRVVSQAIQGDDSDVEERTQVQQISGSSIGSEGEEAGVG